MKPDFRIRPNTDYLHTARWEDLYVLTKHWQSDMDFFKDEIQFLNNLIGKYFIWMVQKENLSNVQKVTAWLSKLDKNREKLLKAINKHKSDLALLMENAFTNDKGAFRNDHVKLEDDLALFTEDFRKVKKEVFEVSEKAIESEKLRHLLKA